jgi:hypothetical protein
MKKLLLYTSLLLLFSSNVIAETYSCSHELSRFNRAGEVETKTYKRIRNIFKHNKGWEFTIVDESKDILILIDYSVTSRDHVHTIIINKKTKEYTEKFLSIESSREEERRPQVYGKCIITLD